MAVSGKTMRAVLLLVLIPALACGTDPSSTQTPQDDNRQDSLVDGDEGPGSSGAVPAPSASGGTNGPGATGPAQPFEWQDPEPPEAQSLAQQVAGADWNRDKVLAIEGSTSRLEMHITSLRYPTSAITGFKSQVVAEETSLEDRLRKLGAEITDLEVTIRLAGSILFDFDKSDIRPDARRTLEEVAAVLQAYGEAPIRVEGHTDTIGSDAYNQTLSEARARSVADWFADEAIHRTRLKALGHGETQPVAGNDTAAGRQLNRRVEIVVERDQKRG